MKAPASEKVVDLVSSEEEAAAELKRLAAEIAGHDRRYYRRMRRAHATRTTMRSASGTRAIEARFPGLAARRQPDERVGAMPTGRFGEVRHAVPMLSLDNAFDDADVPRLPRPGASFPRSRAEDAPMCSPLSRRSTASRRRCATRRASWFWLYARRRRGRRRRHRQPPHHRRYPAHDLAQRRAGRSSKCAAKSIWQGAFREDERRRTKGW